MADSTIGSLPLADSISDTDLFVLEQSGTAKKLKGETLTGFVDRNVISYSGQIVDSDAAGGASYNQQTEELTLILPHGPGIKKIEKTSSRPATAEEISQTEATVDTYTITGEDVRTSEGVTTGEPVGTFSVYNGKNGTGLVNSVMGVSPGSNSTDVAKAALMNLIYPVGSIYMSVNSASPATLFGGTWQRIQGKFLLAAGTDSDWNITYAAGSTGSNCGKPYNTLVKAQLPNETYKVGYDFFNTSNASSSLQSAISSGVSPILCKSDASTGGSQTHDDIVTWTTNASISGGSTSGSAILKTESLNGNATTQQNIDNMPPYLAVYVWKRTA